MTVWIKKRLDLPVICQHTKCYFLGMGFGSGSHSGAAVPDRSVLLAQKAIGFTNSPAGETQGVDLLQLQADCSKPYDSRRCGGGELSDIDLSKEARNSTSRWNELTGGYCDGSATMRNWRLCSNRDCLGSCARRVGRAGAFAQVPDELCNVP